MKKGIKVPLLAQVAIAATAGIGLGFIAPEGITSIFVTFNTLFSNFLGFIMPFIILGLVASAIADLGNSAKRMLIVTVVLAYGFTLFSGVFGYFTSYTIFPHILETSAALSSVHIEPIEPIFTIQIPPVMDVMSSIVLAFVLGLGVCAIKAEKLKGVIDEFKDIVMVVIKGAIVPLLPLYIFGIFMDITTHGQVAAVMDTFLKIIVIIFVMTVVLLIIQFSIAGIVARRNPLKMLSTMLPSAMMALGTQSSAATIPVNLAQCRKLGVSESVTNFSIPLCATIHLSGSTLRTVACALAVMIIEGIDFTTPQFIGFIMMLGVTMVAAPGVPGGAIMASIGVLQSMLGFDDTAIGLMIALSMAMDSFGTACNVTGDAAISVIVERVFNKKKKQEAANTQ